MVETVRLLRFFAYRDLRIVRGSGQYVWDSSGKRYLDFHCGNGVAFLGHCNPVIVKRVEEQLKELIVCPPAFENAALERCLSALSKVLPHNLRNVYFMNSGSEGVELALKLARKRTGRKKFVAFTNSFHGRTMGALSLTYNQRYRSGFEPFPWSQEFLPFNDVAALEKIDEEVAAVIVEPVQGEGGLNVASAEFLKELESRCKNVGAYLIVDEVQSGFGRTGVLWAHEPYGIRPDIMVAGKAIGGGFPVSVVAVTDEIASKVEEGEHGSTYGGSPLALVALEGAIEVQLSDSVAEKAARAGERLMNGLRGVVESYPSLVRGVKGKGLMIGLDLRRSPSQAIKAAQENGLLALKAGLTVLRFLPPYLITGEDVTEAVGILEGVFSNLKGEA